MPGCKVFGLIISIIFITLIFPIAFAHDLQSSDLSNYITPYDEKVIELAEFIGMKPFLSYPLENARSAYYWVSENIQYRFDNQTWGVQEYWQLPSTTIKLGTGDCEDQALLLASLLRALKLPRDNVRLVVGSTGRGTYHAWVEIKLPLPIYGLESVAAHALDILENKKVTVSIGEVSFVQHISSKAIAEVKSAGLSHRDGWIPLDTTAKILPGYPVPFSWWLTYGYNVYTLFGFRVTPLQTFQDKARVWEENKELETGEDVSFNIPCIKGDRIIGVAKAINAWKEQLLGYVERIDIKVAAWGPFYVNSGEKIKVELTSDKYISIYVLTETQYRSWAPYGIEWVIVAPGVGYCGTVSQGYVEYLARYSDNYYVVLWVYPTGWSGGAARIYYSKIKRVYQETTCNIKVSVNNPHNITVLTVSIVKREVEKRFDFTAEINGVYKVVLRNMGESASIYIRLEEYPTQLSPEIAGVSENLALAEQEYVNKIANSMEQNGDNNFFKLLWKPPLNIMLPSMFIVIIAASVYILKKRKIRFSQK